MKIILTMSDILARATSMQVPFHISAETPLECLRILAADNPVLSKWLFKDSGELADEIWVVVNGERIDTSELSMSMRDGDELCLLVAVMGG